MPANSLLLKMQKSVLGLQSDSRDLVTPPPLPPVMQTPQKIHCKKLLLWLSLNLTSQNTYIRIQGWVMGHFRLVNTDVSIISIYTSG